MNTTREYLGETTESTSGLLWTSEPEWISTEETTATNSHRTQSGPQQGSGDYERITPDDTNPHLGENRADHTRSEEMNQKTGHEYNPGDDIIKDKEKSPSLDIPQLQPPIVDSTLVRNEVEKETSEEERKKKEREKEKEEAGSQKNQTTNATVNANVSEHDFVLSSTSSTREEITSTLPSEAASDDVTVPLLSTTLPPTPLALPILHPGHHPSTLEPTSSRPSTVSLLPSASASHAPDTSRPGANISITSFPLSSSSSSSPSSKSSSSPSSTTSTQKSPASTKPSTTTIISPSAPSTTRQPSPRKHQVFLSGSATTTIVHPVYINAIPITMSPSPKGEIVSLELHFYVNGPLLQDLKPQPYQQSRAWYKYNLKCPMGLPYWPLSSQPCLGVCL
jgi:hypothetical protein